MYKWSLYSSYEKYYSDTSNIICTAITTTKKYVLFLKQDVTHDEILSLFQKVKLGEMTEDELLNIEKYGILSNAHNKVLEKVNNDKKLAKKLI